MNPRLYLTIANTLIDRVKRSDGLADPTGRAECRSAISRAYYAAFLVAIEFLNFLGIEVCDSGLCHTVTRNGLNNSGESDLAAASSRLGTMCSERKYADYEMGNKRPESINQAEAIAQMSQETIDLLGKCQQEYSTDVGKGLSVAQTILNWAKTARQEENLKKKGGSRRPTSR